MRLRETAFYIFRNKTRYCIDERYNYKCECHQSYVTVSHTIQRQTVRCNCSETRKILFWSLIEQPTVSSSISKHLYLGRIYHCFL